jgi:pimeloyl-ACP methyl ester carboxylesterase
MAEPDTRRTEFFDGFKTERIKTSGAAIHTVYGGNRDGSSLLLLHGIPETHVLWRKVAPALAHDYFVVMTDLRGYGDSTRCPAYEKSGIRSQGPGMWRAAVAGMSRAGGRDCGLRRDRPNRRSASVRRTAAAVSANPLIRAANQG